MKKAYTICLLTTLCSISVFAFGGVSSGSINFEATIVAPTYCSIDIDEQHKVGDQPDLRINCQKDKTPTFYTKVSAPIRTADKAFTVVSVSYY